MIRDPPPERPPPPPPIIVSKPQTGGKRISLTSSVVVRPTHFGSHHPGFLSFGSQHNLLLRNDGLFSTNLNYEHIVRSNLTKSQEVQADLKKK